MKTVALSLVLGLVAGAALAQPASPPVGGWSAETPKEADATLSYATAEGEQLAMSCVRGSGQVTVRVAAAPEGFPWRVGSTQPLPVSVSLISGTAKATLRGQAALRADGGEALISTEFATRAPVVDAFRKSGVLQVAAGPQVVASPTPAPKGPVGKFFRACK